MPSLRPVLAALLGVLTASCVVPNPSYETDQGPGVTAHLPDMTTADGPALVQDGQAPPQAPPPDAAPGPPPAPADLAPSSGKLCDPCNPQSPACNEPGGLCLVVDQSESFCTRACVNNPCPSGYTCMEVKVIKGSVPDKQCVPVSLSCTP